MFFIFRHKKTKKRNEILDLIEALPERYKKTANRKIEEGENLLFDPIKGIVNEKGEIIVDILVCKDKLQDVINQEENEDNKEEGKTEEKKTQIAQKDRIIKNEHSDDEDEEFEDYDEDEDEDEDEGNEEEIKEELIDTFKEKTKISK